MPGPSPLQCGEYYHIFNRGTNGENIFAEERNYSGSCQNLVLGNQG